MEPFTALDRSARFAADHAAALQGSAARWRLGRIARQPRRRRGPGSERSGTPGRPRPGVAAGRTFAALGPPRTA